MFEPDEALIRKARQILFERDNLYWIIGGSCSGKSTICRAISQKKKIPIYDMDEHIYGPSYGSRITKERHPAMTTWFTAANPFAWIMSLSAEVFDALNRATNAEFLDMLSNDLAENKEPPLLIDGGFTHPTILTQVVAPSQIICLATTEADAARQWETDEARAGMKEMVYNLPDPDVMWQKFLQFDRLITQTMAHECQENQVKIFLRDEKTAVADLAGIVVDYFGL